MIYMPGSNPVQDAADPGNSAPSFSSQRVKNITARPPGRPTALEATTAAGDITLNWTAPVDDGRSDITGYKIEVSYYKGDNFEDLDTGETITYTHTAPDSGRTYIYRVSAINVVGTGEASDVATATAQTVDGRPSAPRTLRARAKGEMQINLSWDPPGYPGDPAFTGYKIEVCIADGYICAADDGTNWEDVEDDTGNTAMTYSHTGLDPGTTYAYRVSAINTVGTSTHNLEPHDLSFNARTESEVPLSGPANLSAVPGDQQVTLQWRPHDSWRELPPDGIDGVAILTGYRWQEQRKVDNGITEAADGEWRFLGGNPDCNPCRRTMMELRNGETYTFFVQAQIAYLAEHGAQGAYSQPAQIEATPGQPPPPAAPEDEMPDDEMIENTPPIVAIPLMDQTETAGVAFTYVIPEDAFTDADGDPLAYTAATSNGDALPGWLTFTAATRTFTGTPAPGDGGTVLVTVTASDGMAAASDEFALTVRVVAPSTLQAWTSRFGRTVATHVTDAVGERLRGAPGQASHVTVGGYQLPLEQHAAGGPESTAEAEADTDPLVSLVTGLAGMVLGPGATRLDAGGTGMDPWAAQPEADPRLGASQARGLPTFRLRDVLLGSSFRLALGADATDSSHPRLTAWGRVAGTQFNGRDRAVALDGDVITGTLGVDSEWERWLAGVAVSHSRGDGSYRIAGTGGDGELENALTSIHPYLRYAVNERLDVWGVLGYGWGDVTLKPGPGVTMETGTTLVMGSFGGRGILLPATEHGGFELATRTDAMLTRMTSDADAVLDATDADAHRLRLVLEGSRPVLWPEGESVTPSMTLGLRHDWGDAETGFGLELGGRVQYADPGYGLTMEAAVRGLLAHEDSDYQEWGASGTIRIDPGPTGQGLALTLSPTWGAAASGVDRLWSRQTTAGLAPQGNRSTPAGQLNAEVGYGVRPFGTGLLTPYVAALLSDGHAHSYRLGTSWTAVSGLSLTLEGRRQESPGPQPPNQGLHLQIDWGF